MTSKAAVVAAVTDAAMDVAVANALVTVTLAFDVTVLVLLL